MRVMLHGATNLSNFGDYIFAEMFYSYLVERGHKVEFYNHPRYGIGSFFRKHLNYVPSDKNYHRLMKQCDALVLFSGGYFVEPLKKGLLREFRHIDRYCHPALNFMRRKLPIYIMGVGAGPFTKAPFSRIAKTILNYATVLTVRNDESKKYCVEYGVTNSIMVTADTALLIKQYMQTHNREIPLPFDKNGKALCLLHIDANPNVMDQIRTAVKPALCAFLTEHSEYMLVLISDVKMDQNIYKDYQEMFEDTDLQILQYENPWLLCSCIKQSDLIITTKLHVGIIGCAMGVSVLSFPFVPNKTKRFYKQIGEPDRCIPIMEINQHIVISMLKKYHNTKINVPNELIDRAKRNLQLLP